MQTDREPDLGRYAAAIVGMVLGQLAGNSSHTLAKVILFVDGEGYTYEQLAETSLHVILVLTGLGVVVGTIAAFRGLVGLEQVLTAVLSASVVGLAAVVDYSLPTVDGEIYLPFPKMIYYIGWVAVLWFVPLLLLPYPDRRFRKRLRQGCEVLLLVTAMTIGGVLAGLALEATGERALITMGDWMGQSIVSDPLRFWIVRPATLNGILGAYSGVAFLNIWWPGRWRSRRLAWRWTLLVTAFAVPYAGVYGAAFWDSSDTFGGWQEFLACGALPLCAVVAALMAYALTRPAVKTAAASPSRSSSFWLILIAGLAIGLGVTAWLGLAPLASSGSLEKVELSVLVAAHGANGVAMGLVLLLSARSLLRRWS